MINWIWNRWFLPCFLEIWEAEKPAAEDRELVVRLHALARAMRVAPPELHLVTSYGPHAFMLAPMGVRPHLVIYRGLLQLLTGPELDAVFCHLLAQQRFASFRWAPWLVLPSYLLANAFRFMPTITRSLLHFGPLACLRGVLRPQRFFRVDKDVAMQLGEAHSLVAALQKSAVLAQKLKPTGVHWSWDFLSWISPSENDLSILRTHPLPQARTQALLELHS